MAKNVNPIFLRDKVEVVSTAKDKHHKTGDTFKVHPVVADALYKKGMAAPMEAKKQKEAK